MEEMLEYIRMLGCWDGRDDLGHETTEGGGRMTEGGGERAENRNLIGHEA
jgi:hypothetical protein